MPSGKTVKKVLFVCVGNTCRSQIAEGFANALGRGKIEVRSAGTSATGHVNKATIEAMKERGIDISAQSSKQLTDEMIDWADVVVTLGCCSAGMLCPADFKGKKTDWKIEDPLGRPPEVLSRVRDEIERKVKEIIAEDGA